MIVPFRRGNSAMFGRMRFVLLLGVLACGGCSRQKSTTELLTDLNSSEEKDRIIAVRLLPQRKGAATPEIVQGLIKSLKDTEGHVRWSAAIGLGYFGEQARDAIPALQATQRDHDARVREAAGVALSRIDPTRFTSPPKSHPSGSAHRVK
jgi:HEAT repeat protein